MKDDSRTLTAEERAAHIEAPSLVSSNPERRADEGWNDRVRKTAEDYGKTYLSVGGTYLPNSKEAAAWTLGERAEYVRGWNAASAKIASLAIREGERGGR